MSARPTAAIHRQTSEPETTGPPPAAPPYEKTSEQLEATYRRLGDQRRANAIRMCRSTRGTCNAVLTQSEVAALYALASTSRGNRTRIRAGVSDASPTLALLMGSVEGGLTSAAGAGGAGEALTRAGLGSAGSGAAPAVGTAAEALAGPELAAGSGTFASAASGTAAEAVAGTGAGIGTGAMAATGVAAIIAICVIAGYQLWQMARFQTALEAAGYIILDDPLQVCIRGCHQGTAPQPVPDLRILDPSPPLRFEDLARWLPRAEPRPQPRPVPRPFPDPDTEDEERCGCRGFATFQRGGNTCHDRFATAISGVPREWMLSTPERLSESFDARGQDGSTLWETKTGYGWLNRTDLTPRQQRWRDAARERWAAQAAHQQVVADRCGYQLRWAFTSEEARRFADPIVQAPTVTFRFSCSDDGERGL